MLPFHDPVADEFTQVNELIIRQLHSDVPMVENIGHYLIEAGGKRLRPLLVLLVARALNYQGQHHLDLAAIIEFIHSATLLHDDVVDMSSLRRGRPTVNAEWGNAPSVLVGDFLYSRSFQMMVRIGNMDVMTILSSTTNIIAEGEVQQLINAKDPDLSEADYREVIRKKTAVLFAAACEVAAAIAGADQATRAALGEYGLEVGLAFQLVDDALDYRGDTETLGKNVGDDLAEGKPTLPLIYAMSQSAEPERNIIRQAIQNGDASKLEDIVAIVDATGAMEYTLKAARDAVSRALLKLEVLPASRFRQAMQELAEFALARDH
ncbi:polyprenyl synthetase family protein [Gilvimarinus sp. SDUM040013]|uniref:Polyprenyl synthetase family protein n=1 Tax=Gilvimarinus gilvus TaxID=3058038 RepID=A0ABU4RWE6_9GAMM|nr:polyprenyl synthetase family protein [Gilvimarinus sp. SDUM040013]MDO3387285.1 polyprenyl synthetase family protein [Gilvimarinus sp. SDUM040013]MDX6848974.1 polyprenyl synthetase family protein [Gilvimarinus sp. SDUM040013]